ncbi:MAG: hypothetical protein ACR2JF_14140 [Iamia sp.]
MRLVPTALFGHLPWSWLVEADDAMDEAWDVGDPLLGADQPLVDDPDWPLVARAGLA